MRSKYFILGLLTLSVAALSSCSLLPEEEAVRTAPILKTYQRESYEFAQVERGDLTLIEKLSCKYVPVRSASMSFALGGEYIDRIFVSVGDNVTEGQLLAQLQLGDLEERIANAENKIAELELRLSYLRRQYELDLQRIDAKSIQDPQVRQDAITALEQAFADDTKDIADSMELQRMTLSTLEESLAERQIRAPFDGTITYTASYKEGDVSVFGSRAVDIADSTMSLFRVDTDLWPMFQVGDEHEITVNKTTYSAVVTDEAALGLPVSEKIEGEKAYVYFALKEPSFELEDGDRGNLYLVIEEHLDVLTLPSAAVSGADGQSIVYYQRDDGMKGYKVVEVGLTVDRRTEILSGLEEGEFVIVN